MTLRVYYRKCEFDTRCLSLKIMTTQKEKSISNQ